ncbi:MAG TPA: hypothetical protein VFN67_37130 [Polyangiales bacterium]|nr:hypothetical protein [Polyangiales bacterium]
MHLRALRPLLGAAGLTLCCNLLGSACSKKDTSTQDAPAPMAAGMTRPRPTPTAILRPVGSSPEPMGMGSRNTDPTASSMHFEAPPPLKPEQAAAQPAEGPAKVRDYSAELSALLKQGALSCLAGWDSNGKTSIDLQVTAQVMGSGTISRAEVRAAGVTPTIVACVQKQAGALQLQGPIEAAPRSVSASLTLLTKGTPALQPRAAEETNQDERDENPHDSKIQDVANDPPEVMQKDEPVREAPEPPEPRDAPPTDDTPADEQP